ncbi:hypothetical protein AHiyo1_41860 [Arthrobacter sp. Hiyo1]|nr:hypothetical protein AHiyo1_41860 [Arthrobacter sp. Hiyo1]
MAQDHQALDALDAGEPATQAVDRVDVDAAVPVERRYRCGNEPAKIDGHESFLCFLDRSPATM